MGIIPAEPSPTLTAYQRWIDNGMHGAMGYLARPDRIARRQDLNLILPGVRSMIIVGLDYVATNQAAIPESILTDPSRGRIATYAWGIDYHDIISERLNRLAQWLNDHNFHVYVDTGAILERSHAQQAGLGFIGKNTMLIHPRRGSTFFLGEILTDVEFDSYDTPHRPTMCGTCTRCLNACPTDAFPQPHILDARRCISYHTIENKGWIDRDLRPHFGNWVFGCDICQDVCPFQRFTPTEQDAAFQPPNIDHVAPPLLNLLTLDEDTFVKQYHETPIYRIKRERMVRNACVAAGNWGNEQAIPHLIQLLYDESPLVRGHAAWALWPVMGDNAYRLLAALYDREHDQQVKGEIEALIG